MDSPSTPDTVCGAAVKVGEAIGETVALGDGVTEGGAVGVSVTLGEAVGEAVALGDGVAEGGTVGVSVTLGEGLPVGVSVARRAGVAVSVAYDVADGDAGVMVALGDGVSMTLARGDELL